MAEATGMLEDEMIEVIGPKRKCCLGGIDQIVLPLTARGLVGGEIVVHLDEVYGARVSNGYDQPVRKEGHRGGSPIARAGHWMRSLSSGLRRRDRGEGS